MLLGSEKKSGNVARARVLTRFLRLLRQEDAAAVKRDASCWTSREGRLELALDPKSARDPDFVPKGGEGKEIVSGGGKAEILCLLPLPLPSCGRPGAARRWPPLAPLPAKTSIQTRITIN